MRPSGRLVGALISAASLVAGSTTAISCGYEDPSSADTTRGILNWTYPHALYVTSAVWSAQSDGVIPPNESAPTIKALLGYGYRKAVKELDALRDGLSVVVGGHGAPAFSVVLIGPMLWTRFETTGTTLTMTPPSVSCILTRQSTAQTLRATPRDCSKS